MDAERSVETGLAFGDGDPLRIRIRERGHFTHLDDEGAAVANARALGVTRDWLDLATEIVERDGFNVNRRGVVFVTVGRGRDIDVLVERLADSAYAVYSELVETATSAAGTR